jgi:zinc and cadmium transporter
MTLVYVLVFSFVGSVASLMGGVALLLWPSARRFSGALGSFAAGALLGAALLDLMPEGVSRAGPHTTVWALAGFLAFYAVGTIVASFHRQAIVPLIIIGDTLHNFIDGIVIGGTFVAGVPLGIVTSLAVAAHEIPQEVGDFAILLNAGMSRKRVLGVNVASAAVTIVGALLAWSGIVDVSPVLGPFLAATAGMFLYIAVDLMPPRSIPAFLGGVIVIAVCTYFLER